MAALPLWNRRDFIKAAFGTAGYLVVQGTPLKAFAKEETVKLTILHTNDVHSRIEPFPMDGSRNAGMGGFARRATLVEQIRAQEKNVLLLDAGDMWQGTPYFNFFGGSLEYKLMSEMGYDAATIGNHDFDIGLDGLLKQLPNATFPLISSNYDFRNTILDGKVLKNKIFEKQGIRIGVYGLGVELDGLVPESLYKETIYNDPLKEALAQEKYLAEEQKCDLIICLSHLGYKYKENKVSDQVLAPTLKYTDLIIGGHTHTFMPEPERVMNAAGQETMIFQVGFAGINLGRVDFILNKKTKKKLGFGNPVKIS